MSRGSQNSKAFEVPVPFLDFTGLQLISIVCFGKSQSEFFGTAVWRPVSVFPKVSFLEIHTEDLTVCFLMPVFSRFFSGWECSGAEEEMHPGVVVPGGATGGWGRSRTHLELSHWILQSSFEHSGRRWTTPTVTGKQPTTNKSLELQLTLGCSRLNTKLLSSSNVLAQSPHRTLRSQGAIFLGQPSGPRWSQPLLSASSWAQRWGQRNRKRKKPCARPLLQPEYFGVQFELRCLQWQNTEGALTDAPKN